MRTVFWVIFVISALPIAYIESIPINQCREVEKCLNGCTIQECKAYFNLTNPCYTEWSDQTPLFQTGCVIIKQVY